MSRRKNTPACTLTFTGYDADGLATAQGPDGVEIHVSGGAVGDRAEVLIEHQSPHQRVAWGRLLELLEPGADRLGSPEGAGHSCGGCSWSHLTLAAQRRAKAERLQAAFAALTIPRLSALESSEPALVHGPPDQHYRNRAKYVLARQGDRVGLGAYRPRTHDFISTLGCPVVEPAVEQVAGHLQRALNVTRGAFSLYDEKTGKGLLRYAGIRANGAGEVLLTLVVTATPQTAPWSALVERLCRSCPALVGVTLDKNASAGNVIFSGESRPLWGAEALEERYGEARVWLAGDGFGQVNRGVATRLYEHASSAAHQALGEPGQLPTQLWDLFCGAGALTQQLALAAPKPGVSVLGVERDATAVGLAREAAAGLPCRFEEADANALLAALEPGKRPDVVVLNPPRSGCRPALLESLVEGRIPRLVYVSCSPETLVRDLAVLGAGGYGLKSLQGFDMLPLTPHVEVVAVLER